MYNDEKPQYKKVRILVDEIIVSGRLMSTIARSISLQYELDISEIKTELPIREPKFLIKVYDDKPIC